MIEEVTRLEAELEALRDAARSDRDHQRDFVRRAGHDLKAPLRGLRILTSFLREDVADDLDEDGRELLDRIDARVIDMEGLVTSLASYARSADADEAERPVGLRELIEGAVRSAMLPDDFASTIDVEESELHLPAAAVSACLVHVVANAWQHHVAPDGQVSITARFTDGFVVFVVADDGPGVDDRTALHMFEPFRAGPPPPLTGSRRAGMGLAIASASASAYSGSIRLLEHRSGTTIELRWPLRRPLPLD